VPPGYTTDLDANARIFDGNGDGNPVVDIGAYESQIVVRVAHLDIKPGTCPNSLGVKKKGTVAVAIAGADDFDVSAIEVSSVSIVRVGGAGRLRPTIARIADCATAYQGALCGCHSLAGDGRPDLLLSFGAQELASALGLSALPRGGPITLTVRGRLRTTGPAEAFVASDCISLVPSGGMGLAGATDAGDRPEFEGGSNGSTVVTRLAPLRQDLDADGDVDLGDFDSFRVCFNGPNRPHGEGCSVEADFDDDGDVDLADFTTFQACFNGPNRPPACS
jgi:hypothetical protein